MVVYSVWRPDGGYDYYEAAHQVAAIGNDLPTPELIAQGPIGVPSVEAGRPLPSGAHHVGTGRIARGLVSPTDMSRLGMAVGAGGSTDLRGVWFLIGAASVGALWLATSIWRRRR